jgi:hypothetical protein
MTLATWLGDLGILLMPHGCQVGRRHWQWKLSGWLISLSRRLAWRAR